MYPHGINFFMIEGRALGQQVRRFLMLWPQYICALLNSFSTMTLFAVNTKAHTCCLYFILSSAVVFLCPDFKFLLFHSRCEEVVRRE